MRRVSATVTPIREESAAAKTTSRRVLSRFLRSRDGRAGLVMGALVVLMIGLGPTLWTEGPEELHADEALEAPSRDHPLGTDRFGRDELARVLDGGRRTLTAAPLVLGIGLVAGVALGVVAGVGPGFVDTALMRLVDVVLAMPGLILPLAVVGALGPSLRSLVLALAVSSCPSYARLARGCVLGARSRPDVVASRLAGVGWARATATHVLPAVMLQVLVVATLDLGLIIAVIAGLSFIGLGVQAPMAEWGSMLADSRAYIAAAPWLLLGPAIPMVLSILAADLVGEALQAAADPRRQE